MFGGLCSFFRLWEYPVLSHFILVDSTVIPVSAREWTNFSLPVPHQLQVVLLLHPDTTHLPCHRYIDCGSQRSFHSHNSNPIRFFWSAYRHPSQDTSRVVDHNVLASLARSASALVKRDNITANFGLLNIRSLTNKGHLIQYLLKHRKLEFLCLSKTCQQPKDFSQLNNFLAIIHHKKWKVVPGVLEEWSITSINLHWVP